MLDTRSLYLSTTEDRHSSSRMALLRILTVVAMVGALLFAAPVTQRAEATPPPFDGWTYNSTTDHYYKIVDAPSWQSAEASAISYGGHLATINDAAEEQ